MARPKDQHDRCKAKLHRATRLLDEYVRIYKEAESRANKAAEERDKLVRQLSETQQQVTAATTVLAMAILRFDIPERGWFLAELARRCTDQTT